MSDEIDSTGPDEIEKVRGPGEPMGRPKAEMEFVGSSGLRQFGGFVQEEFLPELVGVRGAKVYRQMADNDPIVGAVLFAFTMLIRQADWKVQAVDESDEALAAKEFLESIMDDMGSSWANMVAEICTMFVYGYAPMEVTWKRRVGPDKDDPAERSAYTDRKLAPRSIALRAQVTIVRWDFDTETGEPIGVWQQPWAGPMVYIPMEKMLLFRTTAERGNPEGRSILRNAYRPWHYKTRIENIEAIGVERDLAGLPVARIPGQYFQKDASPQEKGVLATWTALVQNIRRDQKEGIVMPSDKDGNGNPLFDLQLINSGGSRTFDTSKIVERYDRGIATSVLADFIFLGQQAVGSFALSSDKTALFATALGGFLKAIAAELNDRLVTAIWDVNGLDRAVMPKFQPGDLEHANLAELADFIQKLSAAGVTLFPDRELENALRTMAGLPPAPEDGLAADPAEEADMRLQATQAKAGILPGMDPNADPNADPGGDPPDDGGQKPPVRKGRTKIRKTFIYDDRGLLAGVEEEEVAA